MTVVIATAAAEANSITLLITFLVATVGAGMILVGTTAAIIMAALGVSSITLPIAVVEVGAIGMTAVIAMAALEVNSTTLLTAVVEPGTTGTTAMAKLEVVNITPLTIVVVRASPTVRNHPPPTRHQSFG